ncbi:hypothetical protein JCM19239_6093 [Vibrio variabilis]|uniref:Uncharacterized protein n=1 Tax=Vibrio variabilis TaxID=990271 RepID=A0ABQ0JJR9_9VIBR|nr:hypothetical protein JCM19239_6093 [Vibrio variabilis]
MFQVFTHEQAERLIYRACLRAESCMTAVTFIGFYRLSRHALSEWCNE